MKNKNNMKNITISLIVLAVFFISTPANALEYPMSLGYDGIDNIHNAGPSNCVIRRLGNGIPFDSFQSGSGINWCNTQFDTIKRIYALEQSVIELQGATPVASSTTLCDTSALEARIQALENRTSIIEQVMQALQKTIGDSLRNIILLLMKNK